MRVGAPIALAGYGILAAATSLWLMAVAFEAEPIAPVLAAGVAATLAFGLSLRKVTPRTPQSVA